jgi:anti-sigma regulatory factor (Ser/Thr protein kinase)/ActR/RegA family two-component response regulator
MHRILITGPNSQWTYDLITGQAFSDCVVEVASGVLDTLRRLRQRSFEVVITDPESGCAEDLQLFEEMVHMRPGLKVIILAPKTTPEEVITALRSHVFALFSVPCNADELTTMIAVALESQDWRGGIEVVSAHRDWIELRVECHLLTAERLANFMGELAGDISSPQRTELITAFREVLLNAMEHGCDFQSEKVVEVSAIRTARAIVYYYRDPGTGFQLDGLHHAAVSNPDDDPLRHLDHRAAQGLRPGGFGILITKRLVDQIIYSERGNEVILIKHTDLVPDSHQVWPREAVPAAIAQ